MLCHVSSTFTEYLRSSGQEVCHTVTLSYGCSEVGSKNTQTLRIDDGVGTGMLHLLLAIELVSGNAFTWQTWDPPLIKKTTIHAPNRVNMTL